jgi:ribonuclease H2 subunit A
MGIDEAGRGPVLGPLVYAGFVCRTEDEAELKRRGYADSKTLREERRDELYAQAGRDPRAAWFVRALSPQYLSRAMQARARINLNALSHAAAASLVQRALDVGLAVVRLLVDTVGDPARYRQFLCARFPSIPEVIVAARADATYGPVSAASVVAKVTRDARMRGWRFCEPGLACSTAFGSGYPADPATKAWLHAAVDPVFGFPSVMRFSWKTCHSVLFRAACPVVWEDDDSEESALASQTRLHFLGGSGGGTAAAPPERYRFFGEEGMDVVMADSGLL